MLQQERSLVSDFTMVNRPEDLAEGTGADHLLMAIWKEGSGEEAFTDSTDSPGVFPR